MQAISSLRFALCGTMAAVAAAADAGVAVRFDPGSAETGPFPSDSFTVADAAQKTGLRVNLPLPDCRVQAAACAEMREINQLDGFDIEPRLRVTFSGPVDPATLKDGIFLVALQNFTDEEIGLHPPGSVIPINQVVYDPSGNAVFAKPDQYLDQHRRYALLVTDAVHDAAGGPVRPDPAFAACLGQEEGICGEVGKTVRELAGRLEPRTVVAASLFTTATVTGFLEKARDWLYGTPPAVRAGPAFAVADLASIALRRQVAAGPARFQDAAQPLELLQGVGRIAFGSFAAPGFLNRQQVMVPWPTASPVPPPAALEEIHFQVFLPATPRPPSGYPVAIAGHGLGGDRFGLTLALASALAAQGFAVAGINAVGHGYGPEGRVILKDRRGETSETPMGGRAVDVNGDGAFGSSEGCNLPAESVPVGWRDCQRQTALDLVQFTRAIEAGIPDLDPGRIYYVGQSMGSIYGTVFAALAPAVRAAVLNVGGGTGSDISRCQSPDDAYALRNRPVRILADRAALPVQEFRDRHQWLEMSGDPIGFAMHLNSSALPGVPVKRVLFQIAKGDRSLPNPASSNLVRAAGMRETASLYLHDLARAAAPQLAANPHGYLTARSPAAALVIAQAAQRQMAGFLAGDGKIVPDVNGLLRPLFETPLFEVPESLPEDLNFQP